MTKNSKWASVALRSPSGHGLAPLTIQVCSAQHMLHSLADPPLTVLRDLMAVPGLKPSSPESQQNKILFPTDPANVAELHLTHCGRWMPNPPRMSTP